MWIWGFFSPQMLNSLRSRRHYISLLCCTDCLYQMASWSRQVETQKNTMHNFQIVSVFTYMALQDLCLFHHGYHIVLVPDGTGLIFALAWRGMARMWMLSYTTFIGSGGKGTPATLSNPECSYNLRLLCARHRIHTWIWADSLILWLLSEEQNNTVSLLPWQKPWIEGISQDLLSDSKDQQKISLVIRRFSNNLFVGRVFISDTVFGINQIPF